MYYYSAITNTFYPDDLLPQYIANDTLPADAVECAEGEYELYSQGSLAPAGMVRGAVNGKPAWVTKPKPSLAERASGERWWRDGELSRADTEILKAEDGDGVGTPQAWREYRKALRKWPEHEKFPTVKYRPTAPDA